MKHPSIKSALSIHPSGHAGFTFQSATDSLKLVREITKLSAAQLQPIQNQLHRSVPADPRVAELDTQYIRIVSQWRGKMRRLGLAVHGLWQVGFDCEEGWYSWQYPERRIRYFIEYGNTFADRVPVSTLEGESFEWAAEE